MCLILVIGCFAGCKKNPDENSEYSYYTSTITHTITGENSNDGSNNNATDSSNVSGGNTVSGGNNNGSSNLKNVITKDKTFTVMSVLLPLEASEDNYLFEQLFFKRAEEIKKEYGTKIKVVNTVIADAKNLAPLIRAGKQVANVIECELRDMPTLVASGYLTPWDDIKGVNINNPNFTEGYTKAATFGGKHYGLYFQKPPELRYCVIINKSLLKNAGINPDNIYNMVNNKTWNWETFLNYAEKTTNFSKGVYGMGGNPEYVMEMLMNSNNARIANMDSKGKVTPAYSSSNMVSALEFMNTLISKNFYYVTDGMKNQSSFKNSTPNYDKEFISGKIAFLFGESWEINQQIKPSKVGFDYGILPIPIGPNANEYTTSAGHARVFAVTSTNKEHDFTAKIFNAFAEMPYGYTDNEWWKDEIQLSYFQNNDAKSLKVYMDLLNNMVFDYGLGMETVQSDFQNTMFGSMFWGSGLTPTAAVNSVKGKYDATIKKYSN